MRRPRAPIALVRAVPRARLVASAIVALLLTLAVPVVSAVEPVRPGPGQRIDMKVLLLSADGSESGYEAWKAALEREGVPYQALQIYSGATKQATINDELLADYGAGRARFAAVILASGDLGRDAGGEFQSALTPQEWDALARFELTFGIRRIADNTVPSPEHGLAAGAVGASQDGRTGQLTEAGRRVFPYLRGPIPIPDDDPNVSEAFGFEATPPADARWETLVSSPGGGAYLGIFTRPDGREEMVHTVAGNQWQSHVQLLRHGMLNWALRGMYLGEQRNYMAMHVDDLFLPDDYWDPTTKANDYDPAKAIRMEPSDVDRAVQWSRERGVRIDFAFNGGGSDQAGGPADPLTMKFTDPSVRDAFGWVNHTYTHPNLDCSTASYITKQVSDNVDFAQRHGLPIDPAELVTGEHSGLANVAISFPGTIDPPPFDNVVPTTQAGGTLAPGTYDYGITAGTPAGETPITAPWTVNVNAPNNAVEIRFHPVCHATRYTAYRAPTGTSDWTKVGDLARAANAPTDDGANPLVLTITDTGGGTAGAPPQANSARVEPYPQNANLLQGVADAGIRFLATDASKAYPQTPGSIAQPWHPAGAWFTQSHGDAVIQSVPRYPNNIYYNVSTQGQQLAEYNYIYLPPPEGICQDIPGVTTCRTQPATWQEYVQSENNIMFRHLMDNDPRPHFMHQSNLADYNPALPPVHESQGGILYAVLDPLLDRYEQTFDRSVAPLVQPTSREVAALLSRQKAWADGQANIEAYVQDGLLHIINRGQISIDVPVTGTTAGERYAGQRSGWITLAPGEHRTLEPEGGLPAPPPQGDGAPDGSQGGAPGGSQGGPAVVAGDGRGRGEVAGQGRGRLVLTLVKVDPRRFRATPARTGQRRRGRTGTRIVWRLNRSATVRITLDRPVKAKSRRGRGNHVQRWVKTTILTRRARAGATAVRFDGRVRGKPVRPGLYRLTVGARDGNDRARDRHATIRVVKR